MNVLSIFRQRVWSAAILIAGIVGALALPLLAQAPPAVEAPPSRPAAKPVEMKTLAVVALASYDEILNDAKFIGSLIGQPEMAQRFEAQITAQTGGKGLAGLDKAKPLGLIVQTDGSQFLPVVCLPVTNGDELLGAVTAAGIPVADAGENKQITLPGGRTAVFKTVGNWAYLSQNASSLANVPADPQAEFAKQLSTYDLAVYIATQNLPTMYRNLAILTMQSSMQNQLRRQPNEGDAEFAARQKTVQAQMQQMMRQIQELDTVAAGVQIDAPQQRGVVEFTYGFQPGSSMAKQSATYAESRTNFAGFFQPDAAATFNFATKMNPQAGGQDLAQLQTGLQSARTELEKSIDKSELLTDDASRAAAKAAAADFFDALDATIKGGQGDGAASLKTTGSSVTIVAGALIKDPSKIESGLKKLEEALQKSGRISAIKWNAATHGAVNFHTFTVKIPDTAQGLAELLGNEAEVAVGIGPAAVYVGIGKDNLAAVNQAIDASAKEPNKSVPPMELAISVGPLAELAAAQSKDDEHRQRAQQIADLIRNDAQGRDHVRVVLQAVPNGLRYHIEAEEGAMKAAGKAVQESRERAAK